MHDSLGDAVAERMRMVERMVAFMAGLWLNARFSRRRGRRKDADG